MKLDHIVILLSDLEQGMAFYETLLPLIGFQKTRDHVYGNAEAIYLDFRQAGDTEHRYQRFAPGLNHIGFSAPNVEAIMDIRTKMGDAGFEVPEVQSFDEGRALFLKDTDGMRVEIGWDP